MVFGIPVEHGLYHFGRGVANIGDINGDGVNDLGVGSVWDGDGAFEVAVQQGALVQVLEVGDDCASADQDATIAALEAENESLTQELTGAEATVASSSKVSRSSRGSHT